MHAESAVQNGHDATSDVEARVQQSQGEDMISEDMVDEVICEVNKVLKMNGQDQRDAQQIWQVYVQDMAAVASDDERSKLQSHIHQVLQSALAHAKKHLKLVGIQKSQMLASKDTNVGIQRRKCWHPKRRKHKDLGITEKTEPKKYQQGNNKKEEVNF